MLPPKKRDRSVLKTFLVDAVFAFLAKGFGLKVLPGLAKRAFTINGPEVSFPKSNQRRPKQ
jgi:hypothetical protein